MLTALVKDEKRKEEEEKVKINRMNRLSDVLSYSLPLKMEKLRKESMEKKEKVGFLQTSL